MKILNKPHIVPTKRWEGKTLPKLGYMCCTLYDTWSFGITPKEAYNNWRQQILFKETWRSKYELF